jgi:hypothetical protein
MVLIRMGVVADLVEAGRLKTVKELLALCGGEELLIGKFSRHANLFWILLDIDGVQGVRTMRSLVALGVFHQTDVQTY